MKQSFLNRFSSQLLGLILVALWSGVIVEGQETTYTHPVYGWSVSGVEGWKIKKLYPQGISIISGDGKTVSITTEFRRKVEGIKRPIVLEITVLFYTDGEMEKALRAAGVDQVFRRLESLVSARKERIRDYTELSRRNFRLNGIEAVEIVDQIDFGRGKGARLRSIVLPYLAIEATVLLDLDDAEKPWNTAQAYFDPIIDTFTP